ncbi:TadE/TadG family type IV pilus assembly protein [Actinospongicola halichondriae]|uniref:TadE/TadG family type IV pilus assembly protein n=1 Tax=Actinospongicola halichondriae TaxID=3236844 RepID=UPI003D3EC423
MRRPRRDERAVTVIEAAVALPILFLFVLALIDLGTWTLESNKAANAARDGARAGMISHRVADAASGGDRTAVVDAVQAHLPGRTLAADEIVIECVDPDGDLVAGGCAAATIDRDRIRVTTRWEKRFITPLAGIVGVPSAEVRGVATMVIVGKPLAPSGTATTTTTTSVPGSTTSTTSTTTSGCVVTGLSVSPSPNSAKRSGALQNNVDIEFSISGADPCVGLSVEIVAPGGGTATHGCGCSSGAIRTWSYGKNSDNFWTAGQATVRVVKGVATLATTTFTVN